MVRSMYSGVAGMRAHQSKMDVIGNNISNVNTFGYKSGRASFQDVYYQTVTGASSGTAMRGGTNPSQIGYGSKLGNIDIMQQQSTFQMTDNGMDMAIAGEGFFQVQDSDGNTFYTRAGMLRFDVAGNLVDPNGNFVLGVSGNPLGKAPASDRIQLQLPSVNPGAGTVTETINGKDITVSATNQTKDSNVSMVFTSKKLADGQDFAISKEDITSGAITITVGQDAKFTSMTEFTQKMNAAITEANGGKPHPAGDFSIDISSDVDPFAAGALTGAEIVGRDFDIKAGSLTVKASATDPIKDLNNYGITFDSVSTNPIFTGTGEMKFNAKYQAAVAATDTTAAVPEGWVITATAGTTTYTGTITSAKSGAVQLSAANGERIIMKHPGVENLVSRFKTDSTGTAPADGDPLGQETTFVATPSVPSRELGLSAKALNLKKGTEGGIQTAANLESVTIGPDGVIEGLHSILGRLQLGRIDLAAFENPQGLEASGNSYFAATGNSGNASLKQPGSDGGGQLATGSLELSNVDLSREFSDMIVTQRGFQANSRLITVSDEMLTELVNLKR